jgi:hypothetical protein
LCSYRRDPFTHFSQDLKPSQPFPLGPEKAEEKNKMRLATEILNLGQYGRMFITVHVDSSIFSPLKLFADRASGGN